MAKTPAPVEDTGAQTPTEVTGVHRMPGIVFRPGIVYQANAYVRAKLEAAGVLKKD